MAAVANTVRRDVCAGTGAPMATNEGVRLTAEAGVGFCAQAVSRPHPLATAKETA
jgi:hypothetical protein